MSLTDLHPIRRIRESQAWLFDDISPATNPKKIILYSMDPWQLGVFEQFLHLAFRRKGHHPRSLFYDGLLPITAWENLVTPPPPVGALTDRFRFIYECFGINATGISAYLERDAAHRLAEARIDALTDDQLSEFKYRGIPIGRVARRDLFQYTLGLFETTTEDDWRLYRRHLVHAVMSVDLAHAVIESERPDIVVLVNGKSVMYSCMYETCRMLGVQVTTWEEGIYFDDCLVLANNDRAIDFPVDDSSWARFKDIPLTAAEESAVDQYFNKWRNQTATHYVYYQNEERDILKIRQALALPPGAAYNVIFPNIIWDTNALGKDRAFGGMTDWVFSSIDLAARTPDRYLVIRPHPGEVKLAMKTRTPLRDIIESRYRGRLPNNVRIIDAGSELSSYELARHADHCAVYTSTLGVELTLMGLSPLVCGRPFYAGRRLTCDIDTRDEYEATMSGQTSGRQPDVARLKRFLHLIIFRLVKRPEFFCGIHGHPQQPRISVSTFEDFPDSMPIFNEIVESILSGGSFVSHGEKIASCPA